MSTKTRIIRITCDTVEWHERFFLHVRSSFTGVEFADWAKAGCWTQRYDVLAVVEDDTILATVGRTRMILSIDGGGSGGGLRNLREGVQLGSVATRADRQGEGFGRQLMHMVLQDADRDGHPVFLFSSEEALGYYPKFGFEAVETDRFYANVSTSPLADLGSCRRIDPYGAEDRALLLAAAAASPSHRGGLSARADMSVLIWYLFNTDVIALSLEGGRSVVMLEEGNGQIMLREWLGERVPDFRTILPLISTSPVKRVDFGFVPFETWMGADIDVEKDDTALMFIRGMAAPARPLCFPEMLRT